MRRAVSSFSRFSAVAASIVIASAIPAAGETDILVLDDQHIDLQATGTVSAAPLVPVESSPLDLAVIGAPASTRAYTVPDAALIFAQAHASAMPAAPFALAALDPRASFAAPAIGHSIANTSRIVLSAEEAIIGIASFYDDPQPTASGEQYDRNAYTAAAQLEIRNRFGGIRYGRLYQPAYGLGEYRGKKIIVRFNDVGPLKPGRKFDLSRAAMVYFDTTLEKGLLPNFKMTPLPMGRTYPKGPVTDQELAELGIDDGATMNVCDVELDDTAPVYTASVAKPKPVQIAQVQPKAPPVIAKPTTKRVAAKAAPARATKTAKAAPKRPAVKVVATPAPAPAPAAAAAPAPKAAEAPATTPWVKRVWNIITNGSGNQPAPTAPEKRRVAMVN